MLYLETTHRAPDGSPEYALHGLRDADLRHLLHALGAQRVRQLERLTATPAAPPLVRAKLKADGERLDAITHALKHPVADAA